MTGTHIARHVSLRHLGKLTGEFGIYEHASGSRPRREFGYCTDDNARLLIVTAGHIHESFLAGRLADVASKFLVRAVTPSGLVHNRMNCDGRWVDEPSVADCWGRYIWATGSVVGHAIGGQITADARECFEIALKQRSPWLRAKSFAAVGAAEFLRGAPNHLAAREFLRDFINDFPKTEWDSHWMWPEERLTYANAVVPEALIAAGNALGDRKALQNGLTMLDWLLRIETHDDRLSVTPVGGRSPGDKSPAFDQQPIEPAAIAQACSRAQSVAPDPMWQRGLKNAVTWFLGHNDARQIMIDPVSGGGFDGLLRHGVNLNQGAESTLAMVSTMQHLADRKSVAAH